MVYVRTAAVLAIVLGLFLALSMPAGARSPGDPRVRALPDTPTAGAFVEGEVLARFSPSARPQEIDAVLRAHGLRVIEVARFSRYLRLGVAAGSAERAVVAALQRNPLVDDARLNLLFGAFACPAPPAANDPDYCLQWHYNDGAGSINVEEAWGALTGPNEVSGQNGAGVIVAVIDSGLAYQASGVVPQAPEWAGQQWKVVLPAGVNLDLVNDDAFPNDDNGHGTHVSNTITQHTHNGLLGAGVANGARLMPIKAIGADGSGTLLDLVEGVEIAAAHGAGVVNMSLGFPAGTTAEDLAPLGDAIARAYSSGVVFAAASGNSATTVSYPAAYPQVIAVGAVKYDGALTYYSNYGADQELVAPGGQLCGSADIWCQIGIPLYGWNDQNADGWPDGVLQETCAADSSGAIVCDDWFFEGTSMASPHVAAVAALVLGAGQSAGLTMAPDDVREVLRSSARDRGPAGWDVSYGWGVVDAGAAVAAVTGAPGNEPPIAGNDAVTTAEDQAITVNVLANDSDPDGDDALLEVTAVASPANGTATLNADDTVTYTPASNFHGNDAFTYTIEDSGGATATATVQVTVTSVNDPPIAADDSATTAEDTAVTIDVLLNDEDPDGDALAVSGVTQPSGGTASFAASTVTYTPDDGFTGSDSFTYSVTDGNGGSSTATVTVLVEPATTPPPTSTISATLSYVWASGPTFELQATLTNDETTRQTATVEWWHNGVQFASDPVELSPGDTSLTQTRRKKEKGLYEIRVLQGGSVVAAASVTVG